MFSSMAFGFVKGTKCYLSERVRESKYRYLNEIMHMPGTMQRFDGFVFCCGLGQGKFIDIRHGPFIGIHAMIRLP